MSPLPTSFAQQLLDEHTPEVKESNLCSLCLNLRPPHYGKDGRPSLLHSCIQRHHASFAALIASANAGCPLCNLFRPFVESVVKRRRERSQQWEERHTHQMKDHETGERPLSEDQPGELEDAGLIQGASLPSGPSYCSSRPYTASLDDPFESYSDRPSIHHETEGNEAYYYTEDVHENCYGEQTEKRYYMISKADGDGDDELESGIELQVKRASTILDRETEEEEGYWKRWSELGPKPWEGTRPVVEALSPPPSPPPTFESTSTKHNPILQWLLNTKHTSTGPEQLWVTAFFTEEYILPNKGQNNMSGALRLTAGSVSLNYTDGSFCCDGRHVPNLHVLAMSFPGLWKWKYDDLKIPRRRPLKAKEPLFEFFQKRVNSTDYNREVGPNDATGMQSAYPEVLARDILPNPGSQRCTAVVKGWLDACLRDHVHCRNESSKVFPKRLISVGTNAQPNLKLVYGIELLSTEEYVALSHCWGKDTSAITKLERKNEAQWSIMMDEGSLSRNFQDAVRIARQMDVQYLWIDALCIKQDDKNDWTVESSNMGLYYRHAILVVSAISSPETTHGILHERSTDADAVRVPHIDSSMAIRPLLSDAMFVMDLDDYSDLRKQPPSLPLKSRAWTIQERVFAHRLLHYTTEQMIWQCKTCLFGEDGQFADIDTAKPKTQGTNNDLIKFNPRRPTETNPRGYVSVHSTGWFDLLRVYTGRHMTFPSDLLPEISSLAQEIAAATGCTYYAGIWWGSRRTRLTSLLWETRHRFESSGPSARRAALLPGELQMRPTYFAGSESLPSWSWASITARLASVNESGVENASDAIEQPDFDAEFGVPVVKPLSAANKFGGVRAGGYIRTEGYLFPYIGEDTYHQHLLPTADLFEWDHQGHEFATFDVPSIWETSFKHEGLNSESSDLEDKPSEYQRKLSLTGTTRPNGYADKNLFLLYVCSFNEFAESTKKFEWQIFLLLQRSHREEVELDWLSGGLVRKTREIYRRVGLASTPSGTRLKIGGDGWQRKIFNFY